MEIILQCVFQFVDRHIAKKPQLTFKRCSTRNFNYDSQTSKHISVLPLETKKTMSSNVFCNCLRVTCLTKNIRSTRLSLYPMLTTCRLLENSFFINSTGIKWVFSEKRSMFGNSHGYCLHVTVMLISPDR